MCINALRVAYATHDARRYAVQRKATRTQRNPKAKQCTAVVVCCLQINQVRTTDLSIW